MGGRVCSNALSHGCLPSSSAAVAAAATATTAAAATTAAGTAAGAAGAAAGSRRGGRRSRGCCVAGAAAAKEAKGDGRAALQYYMSLVKECLKKKDAKAAVKILETVERDGVVKPDTQLLNYVLFACVGSNELGLASKAPFTAYLPS